MSGKNSEAVWKGLYALLSVTEHELVYKVAEEVGVPVFATSEIPASKAPKLKPLRLPLLSTSSPLPQEVTVTPAVQYRSETVQETNSDITSPPTVRFLGADLLNQMFHFVIRQQWLTFVYVVDNPTGLERYQSLKNRLDKWSTVVDRFRIYLIVMDINRNPKLFHGTRYLKTDDSVIVDKFILDMGTEKKYDMVLMELKDLGMAAAPYKYYFVKNIISQVDLRGFEKGGATLFGFNFISESAPLYRSIARFRNNGIEPEQTPIPLISVIE